MPPTPLRNHKEVANEETSWSHRNVVAADVAVPVIEHLVRALDEPLHNRASEPRGLTWEVKRARAKNPRRKHTGTAANASATTEYG
jgi:hypothetical protein